MKVLLILLVFVLSLGVAHAQDNLAAGPPEVSSPGHATTVVVICAEDGNEIRYEFAACPHGSRTLHEFLDFYDTEFPSISGEPAPPEPQEVPSSD